ncbi:glutamate ligase domain-containing protein [Deinococcus sonorensis]|uniref:tetrahydrofolate synthase n=1 Tax=Deinococcus sonorensis TaxID=309891 RepID=A0ABV8Y653_9DEIO
MLERLHHPDQHFDSLRVVGTNGKGSVCAMLEAGVLAAGQRVGRFTSPHLERFEERIRVAGHELDPARTAAFVQWARLHAPEAAFFDLTLALACQVFAEDGVPWAVMEAGVGGASDATQALRRVRAVLITNVALDHTATLGPTLSDIARDKAGAAQPGVPLLTTAEGEGLQVIERTAQERGAPLYTPASHPTLFRLPHPPQLTGAHQRQNARLAVATLRLFGWDAGLGAALQADWPARLERFELQERTVLLDGAHNPAAAQALALAVPHADVLLFGGLARKDTLRTLEALLEVAQRRVYTHPDPQQPAADLQALAETYGGEVEPQAALALTRALELTPPGGTLLIAGSLYLAGQLRPLLDSAAHPSYTSFR